MIHTYSYGEEAHASNPSRRVLSGYGLLSFVTKWAGRHAMDTVCAAHARHTPPTQSAIETTSRLRPFQRRHTTLHGAAWGKSDDGMDAHHGSGRGGRADAVMAW